MEKRLHVFVLSDVRTPQLPRIRPEAAGVESDPFDAFDLGSSHCADSGRVKGCPAEDAGRERQNPGGRSLWRLGQPAGGKQPGRVGTAKGWSGFGPMEATVGRM